VLILAKGRRWWTRRGAQHLAQPEVTLVLQGGGIVASNDDWGTAPNVADIVATGKAPSRAVESAILITLTRATTRRSWTGGRTKTTGNGLVEIYKQ